MDALQPWLLIKTNVIKKTNELLPETMESKLKKLGERSKKWEKFRSRTFFANTPWFTFLIYLLDLLACLIEVYSLVVTLLVMWFITGYKKEEREVLITMMTMKGIQGKKWCVETWHKDLWRKMMKEDQTGSNGTRVDLSLWFNHLDHDKQDLALFALSSKTWSKWIQKMRKSQLETNENESDRVVADRI